MKGEIVIVRGGGDVSTGSIQKLHRSGFRVLVCEVEKPTSIRRTVCVSEAIFEGMTKVEDLVAVKAEDELDIRTCWDRDEIPVVVDPDCKYIGVFSPIAVVDGIIAKKNLGTNMDMAPITIALGPGFCAGKDVDVVIETNRGHDISRLIFEGEAEKNTGNPGYIMGFTTERVIYAPDDGVVTNIRKIGDLVSQHEVIATVNGKDVKAKIAGIVRGLIREGSIVHNGMKIGDVDPRSDELNNCYTISDKARAIGGGTLEALLIMRRLKNV